MDQNPTVVFPRPKEIIIENRPLPIPKPGELLIKTRCTLISTGTELTVLNGEFPPDSGWGRYQYPFVPGYDNIGEVIQTGEGVSAEWIGRRVGTYGGHAAYVTARAEVVRPVPAAISDEQATFFTIAEIVMNGVRRGQVRWGEAVVVFGQGLLGQLTARFCRLAGARPVIAVDVVQSRLARLPRDPALVPVNAQQADAAQVVNQVTRGRMADVAFEVTGDPALIPGECKVLHRQGRLVMLSSPRGPTLFDFHDLSNSPSYTIIGAHNSSHPAQATLENPWVHQRHSELFFDWLADGELDLMPLISHREPYTAAPQLYQMLMRERGPAMGIILQWAA
jgi:2-desacetyl-2-hydroxyethyl bacteriochlorophyllide A dehydrogenase